MKLLFVSLRTTGLMKEQFEEHCAHFANKAEVYVITNDNIEDNSLGKVKGILHLRFKRDEPWTYLSMGKINRAERFIKDIKPDIVFFFTPHPDNICIIKRIRKCNIVALVHNPIPHSGTKLSERIIAEKQKKLYCKYCKAIFVSGQKLKRDFMDHYDYPARSIYPIKFGALSNLPDVPQGESEKYDIIYFGRFEYYKGIDILLEASQNFTGNYRLLIVGKGEPYFDICKYQGNIVFRNEYVSDEELAKMINSSKIVVMPYRDATGTSTVMQAFQFHKPVIASDVGVFREYVGKAGIIVKPNDAVELSNAINKMMDNEDERKHMGEIGYQYFQNDFDLDTVCEQYLSVLASIIGDRK